MTNAAKIALFVLAIVLLFAGFFALAWVAAVYVDDRLLGLAGQQDEPSAEECSQIDANSETAKSWLDPSVQPPDADACYWSR